MTAFIVGITPVLLGFVWVAYLIFDLAARRITVERLADKIRVVKRYSGHSCRYWTQGRVFGIWVDYEYTIHESQIENNLDRLMVCIENRKKKSEIIKEFDV